MSSPAVLMPADIRFPLQRANGVQTVKTAAALARQGTPTRLLVRRSDPRPTAELLALYGLSETGGLDVQRLRVLHRRGSFGLPRAAFLAQAAPLAARWLLRGGLVFTRDLQLAELLLRLVRPRRGRIVYEAHAVETLMYGERGALYGTAEQPRPAKARRLLRRERAVWRQADGVVTTTAGIRDSFSETYGPRRLVSVVPNGCDPPAPEFPGLSTEQPPRILYAGQLYPWKGVDVLVEAVALLPQARLVILGGLPGEPDLQRVQALVAARGLQDRCEMPGTVSLARVREELARATVVAVPVLRSSMTERHTSPLKVFEAMAAARPLVASDLPSSREVLRGGESALLVAPGDAAALAAALRRIIDEPALALALARTAWEQARAYSWEERARRLMDLFQEVCA